MENKPDQKWDRLVTDLFLFLEVILCGLATSGLYSALWVPTSEHTTFDHIGKVCLVIWFALTSIFFIIVTLTAIKDRYSEQQNQNENE